jgi:hypothetical protein
MPTSIDPQPADDEIECARCGAHFYYELTRCPNCGVNLYEPDEEDGKGQPGQSRAAGASHPTLPERLDGWVRRITKKPYRVDSLFGAALDQAELFDDLLTKVGGDQAAVERLIEFERDQAPQATRQAWLESAIRRWEHDNRAPQG